jgi:3-methyladenine DNA glycosylase/8-oxoguanine DNA glycosylase
MRNPSIALSAIVLAIALGACGESSQDKAQSTVCDARDDIAKQVGELKSMTAATVTTDAVTQSLNAIKNDLKQISGAQSDLSDDRRSQVEAANKAFASQVQAIASQLVSSLSAADAKSSLTAALQQLETSYQKTFAPVDCG